MAHCLNHERKRKHENQSFLDQLDPVAERSMDHMLELCNIPSPTGYTREIEDHLMAFFKNLGFKPWQTVKGGVWVCLDKNQGRDDAKADDNALLLAAHVDTLGLMVRHIKADGTLRTTLVGGYSYNLVEQENCWVITRDGKKYEGTVRLSNPAVHAARDVYEKKRDDSTMEIVLDQKVCCRDDVEKLGIMAGDMVALEPRARRAGDGYLKSRHLDDKASSAMFLALAEEVAKGSIIPQKKVYLYFSNYEEVGHGAAAGHPVGICDMLAVDMGVVGDDLDCNEHVLSICAKDASGPYNWAFTTELIELAKQSELDFAVDIFPFYVSDASCAMTAGLDYRFALAGTGVSASHGYERVHKDGILSTLALLKILISKA